MATNENDSKKDPKKKFPPSELLPEIPSKFDQHGYMIVTVIPRRFMNDLRKNGRKEWIKSSEIAML